MNIFQKIKNKIINKNELEEIKTYEKGLEKTNQEFISKLGSISKKYKYIDDEYFEELEEILISADIGIKTVIKFVNLLRERVKQEKIEKPVDLKEVIVDELFILYVKDSIVSSKLNYNDLGPSVFLFIGVNGVGKTTSIAKVAHKLKQENKKILLVAADTFRAGAVDQLEEWGKRLNLEVVSDRNSQDPASVVYQGLIKAKEENYDVVLIDTSGRLQNKVNLMKELEKINKVVSNIIENAPSETLLVIDAGTGQNGIVQAQSFKEITAVTGLILTKLDGTAKGGIVLAIKEEVDIPVKYIGLGEGLDDLEVFDIEKYIYGLFKDLGEDGKDK